jgi:deazaflavin-dependent oxidoreductase (nitroreductase family)
MRAPAVFDRRGLRWMLQALSPAPVVVLVHRGHRSGKTYRTPVEALAEDRERGRIVVAPMWGRSSGWYRNVVAGGLIEVSTRGKSQPMESRQLPEEERRDAIATYRENHPLYSRLILRMLVSLHRLKGDPVEALVRELPMLALEPRRADAAS